MATWPPVTHQDVQDSVRVTKRAVYVVGVSPQTLFSSAGNVDYALRMLVTLPVTTTRWRLRIANQHALTGATYNQSITVNSVWLGLPAYATAGRWNGSCTAALTQATEITATTAPATGADAITPWVTASALQFNAHQPTVLATALLTGSTGTGVIYSDALCYALSGGSASIGLAAGGGVSAGISMGDIRIEYEAAVPPKAPIGLVVGASGETGFNPDLQYLPPESWPHLVGLTNNHMVINAGLGGTKTSDWTTSTARPWTRFDLTNVGAVQGIPDYMIIGMLPSNDVPFLAGGDAASTATVNTYLSATQGNIASIIGIANGLGITRIYMCTIPPRSFKMALLSADVAIGATTISVDTSIASGSVITIGSGPYAETVTTTAVSGTGPYTVTVPALTHKHWQSEWVTGGFEAFRVAINKWIRQNPLGIEGVIDFDLQLSDRTNRALIDARFLASDGVHPLQGGHQVMAMSPSIPATGV